MDGGRPLRAAMSARRVRAVPSVPARRRSAWQRVGSAVLALLSGLVMVLSVGGYALTTWFNSGVGRLHLSLGGQGSPAPNAAVNWLLVGTDSRVGTGSAYGGTSLVAGQRSDTAILAHLAADGTTTMVSIPRDTLVAIPAYLDSRRQPHPAHPDKFNAALDLGGPQLVIATLASTFGVAVNHYAAVDLAGFTKLSDAVGGVVVCQKAFAGPAERGLDDVGHPYVSTNLNDPYSGWQGHVGDQTVKGAAALAFVRQRHGLARGDIDRIARQQQFLGAVFRQATSAGVLTDPVRLLSVLNAAKGALTLDDATSVSDLESFATRLRGVDASHVRFVTVPTDQLRLGVPGVFSDAGGVLEYRPPGNSRSVGSVQLLNRNAAMALLASLDQPPAAGPASQPPPTAVRAGAVPPSTVTVRVVNASGRTGLGRSVSGWLAARGFHVLVPRSGAVTTTAAQVRYPPGPDAAAVAVAGVVPGAVLVPDPAITAGVQLVLGTAYRDPASTTHPSTPRPSAPSSAALPPVASAASPANRCTY